MPEMLFELGCEELPAGSLDRAANSLREGIERRLASAGVDFESSQVLYTPRRLIVSLAGVGAVQPDQDVVQRGPGLAAAFDPSGAPTKALEGFCRGQGVDVKDTVSEDGYVWVKKLVKGKGTAELLTEILPAAVAEIPFSKTMRWANGSFRFARPIRWMLAVFDSHPLSFTIEGVAAGSKSKGHRFRSPSEFEAKTLADLEQGLRERFVEPSFEERKQKIQSQVKSLCGGAEPDPALVEENANLTEWPDALIGEFKPEFSVLPLPVLRTVMAKHERFFPVPDGSGGLKNQFVSIRNGGEEAVVRSGNAWVLNARFNDAQFFFEDDKKLSLTDFLEKTNSMAFQEKLGSIRQRCDRLAALARAVAEYTGGDTKNAETAGLYAKADLTTGLVSELDELQGVIGGEYARRDGFHEDVCWALATHYDLEKNSSVETNAAQTAVSLLIADQLDRIAGFTGVGLVPTGSSDPYGIRKSATLLIEAALVWPAMAGGYASLLVKAFEGYAAQGFALDTAGATKTLHEVFAARYQSLLGVRHDICEAATLPDEEILDARGTRFRAQVLSRLADDVSFVQSATRPINIVSAAVKKGIDFVSDKGGVLDSAEGERLAEVVSAQAPEAQAAARVEDVDGVIAALKLLVEPINAFFDNTMVMVDDAAVRNARLRLLAETDRVLRTAGDVSKLVIEG